MIVGVKKLRELNAKGVVHAHNAGPTPDIVIKLFETKPDIWEAHLMEHDQAGVTQYTLPTIIASERRRAHLSDADLKNTIEILGDFFYACDALKI